MQSYQEVTKEVLKQIDEFQLKIRNFDYQSYFYNLKKKEPKRFERLIYDENNDKPFSEDLENIVFDYYMSDSEVQ
ncbi:MAG: hypothetical protein WC812_02165 [Candidatus Pacearchaeota archaeon]